MAVSNRRGAVNTRAHTDRQPEVPAAAMGPWIPLGVAFIAGWVVMMLEILGARLLAPYFGYSIYQWNRGADGPSQGPTVDRGVL